MPRHPRDRGPAPGTERRGHGRRRRPHHPRHGRGAAAQLSHPTALREGLTPRTSAPAVEARAYAAAHPAEADSVQAVPVGRRHRGGGGSGAAGKGGSGGDLAGAAGTARLTRRDALRPSTSAGSPRGYRHTHHSRATPSTRPADLREASAVMAVTGWELANLPARPPRGPGSGPERVPSRPSAEGAGERGVGATGSGVPPTSAPAAPPCRWCRTRPGGCRWWSPGAAAAGGRGTGPPRSGRWRAPGRSRPTGSSSHST